MTPAHAPRDRAAFERVALPFLDVLFAVACRLTGNREEASDLVQETYLRAYRTFAGFRLGTDCKAWLFTILYSVFSNKRRSRRRQPPTQSIEQLETRHEDLRAEGWGSHEPLLDKPDPGWAAPEVERAVAELPEEFRSAVLLVDVAELSYDEAARALGCPVGTVRSRLSRGRKRLSRTLHDYAQRLGHGNR